MRHRFTPATQRVLVEAQLAARGLSDGFIGTEHLLLGLFAVGGRAATALATAGLGADELRAHVEALPRPAGIAPRNPPFTPRAKKVMELALREALALGRTHIDPEHLLLGILTEGEGKAARWLDEHAPGGLLGLRSACLGEVSAAPAERRRTERLAPGPQARAVPRSVRRQRVTVIEQPVTPAAEQALAGTEGPVDTGALLVALARQEGSAAAQALAKLGITAEQVQAALAEVDTAGTADEPPLPPYVRVVDAAGASLSAEGGDLLRYLVERSPDLAAQGLAVVHTGSDGHLAVELSGGLADLLAGFQAWKA